MLMSKLQREIVCDSNGVDNGNIDESSDITWGEVHIIIILATVHNLMSCDNVLCVICIDLLVVVIDDTNC
jgi:hypothetical protein